MPLDSSPAPSFAARIVRRLRIPAEYRTVWSVRNLRLLTISRFLAHVMFYSTVIVAFERSRGLTFTEMFLLESILSAASWLLDIPTGVWADQIGYRRLLVTASMLALASNVVAIFAYGFWPFALGEVLFGASLACASGCEDALVYASLPTEGVTSASGVVVPAADVATSDGVADAAPSEHTHLGAAAFSLLNTASSAGFFVGLICGSFIGARSPTLAVVASAVPMALSLAVTLRLSATPIALPQRAQSAEHAEYAPYTLAEPEGSKAHDALPVAAQRPKARELLAGAWRLARAQPALVGLSLGQSAAFVLVNAIFWYNQPYFAAAHIAVAWYGPLTALAVGAAAVVPLALPLVVRRVGRRWALAVALLAPGLAYLGLGYFSGDPSHGDSLLAALAPLLTVGMIVLVVGGSAWRDPLIGDELARRSPARGRAAALSALSFVGTLAAIALNPLIGRLGDGGLRIVGLGMGGALVALALALPWLLERAHHRPVMGSHRPT